MRIVPVALCLLLTVIIIAELLFWPSQPNMVDQKKTGRSQKSATETENESINGYTLAPLTEFDSITERPLFFEGRRPLPPIVTQVQDKMPTLSRALSRPPIMDLSAILIIDGEPTALLRNPPKGVSTRLKTGDEFQGWQIEKITADRVTLTMGGKSEEFLLREYKKVPLPSVSKRPKQRQTKPRERRRPRQQVRRPRPEESE